MITAASGSFDLLIVDRLWPGLDGVALVTTLPGATIQTPILLLTARDGIDHRVAGLRAGADDDLVKAFALVELSARVAALTCRKPIIPKVTTWRIADVELDRLTQKVSRAGKTIDLKRREFQLLEYLRRHEHQVVTRTMPLEAVWDFHFDPTTSVVASDISGLRAKPGRGYGEELIQTSGGSACRITSHA